MNLNIDQKKLSKVIKGDQISKTHKARKIYKEHNEDF